MPSILCLFIEKSSSNFTSVVIVLKTFLTEKISGVIFN